MSIYKLETKFWNKFGPKNPSFWAENLGQSQITPMVIKYHRQKSESETSDILYESMFKYQSKTKIQAKFGPKKP